MPEITAEKLAAWRAGDWRSFVATCCILRRPDGTIGPLVVSDEQATWFDALAARKADGTPRYSTLGLVAGKRGGKTVFAGAASLFITATDEDRLSVFLGNSRESAESLSFDCAKEFLRRGPLGAAAVVQRGRVLFPALGSELRAVPCSPKSVAGLTVTGALISDELWAADEGGEESWALLSSQKSGTAQALMVSQASGGDSPVFRLYETARDEQPPHLWFRYIPPEWYDEHLSPNPYIDAAYLDERRAELGIAALYDRYFRNCWAEDASTYLLPEDLAAATIEGAALPRTRAQAEALLREIAGCGLADCAFHAGLDRAMPGSGAGDDSYLVTCARTPADLVVPVQVALLPTGSKGEVAGAWEAVARMLGGWPRLLMEVYQTADLAGEWAWGATTVTPSAQAQHSAFTALARLFHERRIRIPAGGAEVLLTQLGTFGLDTSTQPPRYGKKVNKKPDDSVYALAWATADLPLPAPAIDRAEVEAARQRQVRQFMHETAIGTARL